MNASFSDIVERYIQLALHFDKHQPSVVDAAYGKAAVWRERLAQEPPVPLESLHQQAEAILAALEHEQSDRAQYLRAQTLALRTMIEKKLGHRFSFREEARLCLGIQHIEWQDDTELSAHIDTLEHLLEGKGSLSERFVHWRKHFELQGEAIEHLLARHQPPHGDAQIKVGQRIDVFGTHACPGRSQICA
ncbi:MAG: hypothetical protein ACK424_09875 [Candidatus Thermochlorobacter sp.]